MHAFPTVTCKIHSHRPKPPNTLCCSLTGMHSQAKMEQDVCQASGYATEQPRNHHCTTTNSMSGPLAKRTMTQGRPGWWHVHKKHSRRAVTVLGMGGAPASIVRKPEAALRRKALQHCCKRLGRPARTFLQTFKRGSPAGGSLAAGTYRAA